jgi:integrase
MSASDRGLLALVLIFIFWVGHSYVAEASVDKIELAKDSRFSAAPARAVATLTKPGRHSDGGGLYLAVDKDGETLRRRWVFLFRWSGKLKEMGLGGASSVSLARARERATECRAAVADGVNPKEKRDKARATAQGVPTFGAWAEEFISGKEKGWRNAKHRQQWRNTLRDYAKSVRDKPVSEVATTEVLEVLQPIWQTKPETASRVRGRIETILDAARAKHPHYFPAGWANPARWRGHLDKLLSKRQKLSRGHHPAMPFVEVPAFMGRLRERKAVSARLLEFIILTVARSNEAIGGRWPEIDKSAKVWTVPGTRMKGGRDHRVPLVPRAIEILDEMEKTKAGDLIFPGRKRGRPLSNMATDMLLRRMKAGDVTTHGFRSSFRDWAGELTTFPREVAEAALAHAVGDETELAYRRGDALAKRRKLMDGHRVPLTFSKRLSV